MTEDKIENKLQRTKEELVVILLTVIITILIAYFIGYQKGYKDCREFIEDNTTIERSGRIYTCSYPKTGDL